MGSINTCVEQIYYMYANISKTFIVNVYIMGWRENINLIQSEYALHDTYNFLWISICQ